MRINSGRRWKQIWILGIETPTGPSPKVMKPKQTVQIPVVKTAPNFSMFSTMLPPIEPMPTMITETMQPIVVIDIATLESTQVLLLAVMASLVH